MQQELMTCRTTLYDDPGPTASLLSIQCALVGEQQRRLVRRPVLDGSKNQSTVKGAQCLARQLQGAE